MLHEKFREQCLNSQNIISIQIFLKRFGASTELAIHSSSNSISICSAADTDWRLLASFSENPRVDYCLDLATAKFDLSFSSKELFIASQPFDLSLLFDLEIMYLFIDHHTSATVD